MDLRKELGRYDEVSCPDYLYNAWRILFAEYNPPDKQEILRQARFDLREEEQIRKQHVFDRDRIKMEDLLRYKWNWQGK